MVVMSPLHPLEAKIAEIEAAVERRVEIALLRHAVDVALSRLKDLDEDRALGYVRAQEALKA